MTGAANAGLGEGGATGPVVAVASSFDRMNSIASLERRVAHDARTLNTLYGDAVNTLDYHAAPPRMIKKWIKRALFPLIGAFGVYILGCFVPLHRVDLAFMCRVCGRAEVRSTWDVAGVRVWHRTRTLDLELEPIYNARVGAPHQHAWFRYAIESLHGNLWSYGAIGEGGPDEPSGAVRDALYAMDSEFAELPIEQRQAIYDALLKCNTKEEVSQRIDKGFKKTASTGASLP